MATEYDWYKIFNLTEFEALDLVSRNYPVILDEIGLVNVLVTKGNLVSMTFETSEGAGEVMLSLNINDRNPFEFEGFACYVNSLNDVYLGVEIEE